MSAGKAAAGRSRVGRLLGLAIGLMCGTSVHAGAFTSAESTFPSGVEPDTVTHPEGYNVTAGSPSSYTLNVCVVPGSPNAGQIDVAVANIVDTMNGMVPVVENLSFNSSIGPDIDFESVALHELGHCLGLNHPNAASEAPTGTGEERESTKANPGNNGSLNYGSGGDSVFGSPDDIRGDDVNLHYFTPGVNDPFRILLDVDSTNYSRDLSDLPAGDTFASNAGRTVAVLARYDAAPGDCAGFFQANEVCSEAVMQQGSSNAETQRALHPDDVATLLYARSGIDRVAATGDDYRPTLVYRGITANNCNISLSFNNAETGFAVCRSGVSTASATYNDAADAFSLTEADAFFNTGTSFGFSTVRVPLPGRDSAVVSPGTDTTVTTSVLANDTNQQGSGNLTVTTRSLGGPFAGTVSLQSNGTFTYTNTNASVTEDVFIYEVCVSGTDACAWQFVDLTIDALAGDVVFRNGFEGNEP